MSGDIIEIKPGAFGVKINVRESLRWLRELFGNQNRDDVTVVAQRFRQLIVDHGLHLQHAIDIFPNEFGITLEKLETNEKVLSFITPRLLDWTAEYFGVRRDWLDGSIQYIYSYRSYVKNLKCAIDDAISLAKLGGSVEAFLFVDSSNHNLYKDRHDSAAFVMRTEIKELNSEYSIYRYVPCSDMWPLERHYLKRLKFLGRLLYVNMGVTIPIMRVSTGDLNKLCKRTIIPGTVIKPPLIREIQLEDFALLPEESAQCKDTAFATAAIKYLAESGLNDYFQAKLAENNLKRFEAPKLNGA